MDANCPLVTLQLGAAIVSAGGDTNMAVRALQRALGPKGLGMWQDDPQVAWVEVFPTQALYMSASSPASSPSLCPLFGEDLTYLIRQGNLALAQGQFKLNNFQEAAELFANVLKEGAPSLLVLRGIGLSLARLGRFDDAFVHLRTAHEMEEVKERITAGYLALCGACGKARAEDKLQNTAWAIRLVTQFNMPGGRGMDRHPQSHLCRGARTPSRLARTISCNVSVRTSGEREVLRGAVGTGVSLSGRQRSSAQVHPEYAWLYCRARRAARGRWPAALRRLYAQTFAQPEPARALLCRAGVGFR